MRERERERGTGRGHGGPSDRPTDRPAAADDDTTHSVSVIRALQFVPHNVSKEGTLRGLFRASKGEMMTLVSSPAAENGRTSMNVPSDGRSVNSRRFKPARVRKCEIRCMSTRRVRRPLVTRSFLPPFLHGGPLHSFEMKGYQGSERGRRGGIRPTRDLVHDSCAKSQISTGTKIVAPSFYLVRRKSTLLRRTKSSNI